MPATSDNMETNDLVEQLKVQFAVASAHQLLIKVTEKCFTQCIGKPGVLLDSTEQSCILMCMDRYMDAWGLVSRAYGNRLLREQTRMYSRNDAV